MYIYFPFSKKKALTSSRVHDNSTAAAVTSSIKKAASIILDSPLATAAAYRQLFVSSISDKRAEKREKEKRENFFCSLQATMLKKRKHRFKRRNTEPTVNHPMVLSTPSAGPAVVTPPHHQQQHHHQQQQHHPPCPPTTLATATRVDSQQPPVNLADICDSPTHATAV